MNSRVRGWAAAVLMVTASLVSGVSGEAAGEVTSGPKAPASGREPVVAVRHVKPVKAAKAPAVDSWRPPAPVWPEAAAADVALPAVRADGGRGKAVRAGKLPMWIEAAGPATVRVEAVAPKAADKALLVRLSRTDGDPAAISARLTVDYKGFGSAFGGDWASRLRLWSVPECASATPQVASCRPTELPSVVNVGKGTVAAQVNAAPAGSQSLFMLAASSSGPAGDYAATPLSLSATWNTGGNSGDFTWSYPLRMPPGLGGPQPQVALSYSSARVDGRMAAANSQPSWIGEGFEWHPGFIERRYRPCARDTGEGANNTGKTGDLCWATDNAMLSLPGHSGELIKDGSDGNRWHLRDDDGTRVERKSGASNGAKDGEWWVVTTTDGTQHWFGGRNGSQSTLTVPVFGNHTNEPCRQTTFAASHCQQAYRWQLDHVVDTHGNTMRISYSKETNRYARNLTTTDAAEYDRAGYPEKIEYGTRGLDDAPLMRVVFATEDRCLADCGVKDAAHWPDVPLDQGCTAAPCKPEQAYPTFWSTKRLSAVTTHVWDAGASRWREVESWTLGHAFPGVSDRGTAALWLEKISHTGRAGTDPDAVSSLPDVTFTGQLLANRVDTGDDQLPAMNRFRIKKITSETGQTVDVSYAEPECVAGSRMPVKDKLHENVLRCYPVKWTPPGRTQVIDDFFHKHVVSHVVEAEAEGVTSSPRVISRYAYGGDPAWHYTDDDSVIEAGDKTWSVWRGYGSVTTTTGDEDARTQVETRYFRGMHGDRLPSGTRSAKLPAIETGQVPEVLDEDAFAGMVRETITRNVADGSEVSATVYRPWQSGATATRTVNGSTVHARFVGTAATHTRTSRDAGREPRTTTVTTEFDSYGMQNWVEDHGDDAVAGDETCSLTEYTRNTGRWLVDRVSRVRDFALACVAAKSKVEADTVAEADVIGDTRTTYDGAAQWEDSPAPVKGDVTLVESAKEIKDGKPAFVPEKTVTLDDYGRVRTETDARNATTTIAYTPSSGGPVTRKTVTGPLGWVTTTDLEPALGLPVTTTDPNGRVTDLAYDGLGRLIAAWLPGNDRSLNGGKPTIRHTYQVRNDGPVVVTSARLNHAGNYITSHTFYDSLLRPRQTQSPDGAGTTDHAVVTDTFYDSAGRAFKTHNPYLARTAPGATLVVPEKTVPSAEVTEFDGAGRVSAKVHVLDSAPASPGSGTERWRTAYGYGGDREDVTPPAGGVVTSTVKDVDGRPVEVRHYRAGQSAGADTGFAGTSYEFDRKGRLKTMTDAVGNKWLHTYDLRGRLIESTDPDVGRVEHTYNDAGDLLTTKDNAGLITAYTYDDIGRPATIRDDSSTGEKRAEWLYDTLANGTVAKGLLAKTIRYAGDEKYIKTIEGYTVDYRPYSVIYSIPTAGLSGDYTYKSTYHPDGSPKTVRLPAMGNLAQEELTSGYNALGMPTTLRTTSGFGSSYVTGTTYTSFAELSKISLQNNAGKTADITRLYETDTRRLEKLQTVRQTAPTGVSDLHFSYDGAGNVTRLSNLASGDHQCFTTDFLRRLTAAWTQTSADCAEAPTADVVGGAAKYWHSYSYDDIGNRTELKKHGTASGDVVTTYTIPGGAHRLSATSTVEGGATLTTAHAYDASGNMKHRTTASGSQTMTWDREGRLATTQDAAGTTSYVYDVDGTRLIRKDAQGTTLYLPGQEVRYSAGGGKTGTRYYTHAGKTIATRTSGTAAGVSWLSSDQHGTTGSIIAGVADQSVATRRYTPFGEPRDVIGTWPATMDKGFVGGTNDNTGLTHLGAREYDPALGRFISVDPLLDIYDSQQANGYSYANNNPLTFTDPDGLIPRSCPDGVCNGGGGAHQNRGSNPAHTYNPPPRNTGIKGGPCGARPCPPADRPRYGPQGARPRGDNMLPKGGPCGARPCATYEVAPKGWDRKITNPTCADDFICDWVLGDVSRCASDPSLSWDCVSAGLSVVPGGKLVSGAGSIAGKLFKAEKKADDCLGNSFVPETMVVMADGSHKSIDEVRVGDQVLATDPETGETGPREVTALISGDGAKNLVQITVDTGEDEIAGVLTATDGHPFWVPELRTWLTAAELRAGMLLRTSAGTYVQVTGIKRWTAGQRVHNLSVEGLHTYYVLAAEVERLRLRRFEDEAGLSDEAVQ